MEEIVIGETRVTYYDRQEFLDEIWDYQTGEHVTILGPTGSGKTWLAYQLLGVTATPKVPAIVLVMKPRDATVTKWSKSVGFIKTRVWPPLRSPFKQSKPNGWVLWPRFTLVDPDRDDLELHRQFRKVLIDSYKRGNRIVFGDEAYSLAEELGLKKLLITLWTKGRSMGAGLWAASQRPTHVPLWAYNSAEHLFIHNDPDKRARERFGEIGGVDPKMIAEVVAGLERHEFLYIRRADASVCVVGK